ncbi:hypothetical protein E2C01_064153 [Portunus trituberculatus]|uniref:Uncharacterized protein n=1 Tax=Portunus trituberculatus TaxID=210409 RepID=A0A5B7HCB4_PORTR|nr:hypothetical protein [Portunus trituberculatus]
MAANDAYFLFLPPIGSTKRIYGRLHHHLLTPHITNLPPNITSSHSAITHASVSINTLFPPSPTLPPSPTTSNSPFSRRQGSRRRPSLTLSQAGASGKLP